MGLQLFFLPNVPGAMFIQGGTFIPDSRVVEFFQKMSGKIFQLAQSVEHETLHLGPHVGRRFVP